uniref:Uncharacterized protein n=1 Tax=Triticum urartu TaxID=4572 RepID=A0A8R7UIL3_TRIUA
PPPGPTPPRSRLLAPSSPPAFRGRRRTRRPSTKRGGRWYFRPSCHPALSMGLAYTSLHHHRRVDSVRTQAPPLTRSYWLCPDALPYEKGEPCLFQMI